MKQHYRLQDLIDIEQFQALQERLNQIYSFPSAIIDNEGNILTRTAWQDVCTKFHRANHECEKECIKSDRYILDHLSEANPAVSYRCPHGLVDNATPIIIDGQHLGNFFTGQFFLEKPDLGFFREQARKYGFDEAAYLAAVEKVPIWSKSKLDHYLFFIKGLIEVISQAGLKSLKEAEARKQVSEYSQLNQQIISSAQEGIIVYGKDLRYHVWNPFMEQMSGREASEVLGKHPLEVFPFLKEAGLIERLERALAGETPAALEFPFSVSGRTGWSLDTSAPLRNVAGEIIGVIATVQDITERKRVEETLRQSEERLTQAQRAAGAGVWDWDLATGRLDWSPELFELFGLCPQSSPASFETWNRLVHPDDLEEASARISQAVRDGTPLTNEYRIIRSDGQTRWISALGQTVRDPDGRPVRMSGICLDITPRKQAEAALRESESWHRQLFYESGDAIMTLTPPNWRFASANPATLKLFEAKNQAELLRVEPWGLSPRQQPDGRCSADKARELIEIAIQQGSHSFEWMHQRFGGEVFPATVLLSKVELDGRMLIQATVRDITESKRAERALRESESFYHSLVENLHQSVFRKDREGRFTFANQQFCELVGRTLDQLVGSRDSDLFPQELAEKYHRDDCRVLETGAILEVMEEHRTPDGQLHYVRVCKVPILDAHGKIVGVQGIFWDMTEQRRTEEALRESQARYATTLDALNDGLWDWHIPSGNAFFSATYYAILGYDEGEFPATYATWSRLVHPEDLGRVEGDLRRSVENAVGFAIDLRMKTKAGAWLWVCTRGKVVEHDPQGRALRMVGTLTEITQRKQAEEALKQSEQRFRAIADYTVDWESWTDPEGKLLWVNPGVERLTGYSIDECMAMVDYPLPMIVPAERQRLEFWLEGSRHGTRGNGLEFQIARKDGTKSWGSASWQPIVSAGGDYLGCRTSVRDISAQKLLAAQLNQAQKMEAVGQLAGGVAHDFNNIMASTMMHLSLLQQNPKLEPETRDSLGELMREAKRAATLTRQLLTFSRRSVVEVKVLDLNELVANLLAMLGRTIGEHLTLEWIKGEIPVTVEADAGMLEQVVMNLVVNARDAMPHGGRIKVRVEAENVDERRAQTVPGARSGKFVRLSVTDTGCGMDQATQERIFEPFFTTKEVGKGTGLGLATVYGIVQQHQGWVEVESAIGRGSVFSVYLPAATAAPTNPAPGGEARPLPQGSETVLLVEDEPGLRKVLGRFLRGCGYRVLEAATGMEAMEVWEKAAGQVDLLLTDMVMPEGMSGLGVAERLRSAKPDLKVVIMSGYSAEILANQTGLLTRNLTFLAKPVADVDLAGAIRACLDRT